MRFQLAVIGGERLGMGVFPRWTDPYLEGVAVVRVIQLFRYEHPLPMPRRVSAGRRDMSHVRI